MKTKTKVQFLSFIGKIIYIGLDLHKKIWCVAVRCDGVEIKYCTLPGKKELLVHFLQNHFPGAQYVLAYEAGCFGYWLYDYLLDNGITTIITPPNLIPKEDTHRVKNNRIDSHKLARFLESNHLKQVAVPSQQIRQHRGVVRARRQILRTLKCVQSQIRSALLFYGLAIEPPKGQWPNYFVDNLERLRFSDPLFEASFRQQLDLYRELRKRLSAQTRLVRLVARLPIYTEQIELLLTVPGVGLLTAIEILTELYDMSRFSSGDKVASYLGLTPTEYSTGEPGHEKYGHISHAGNGPMRASLIELTWRAIRKDGFLRQRFNGIAKRRGKKIAIVAVARTLAVRIRRVLIRNEVYVCGVA